VSGDSYPTLGRILPVVNILKTTLPKKNLQTDIGKTLMIKLQHEIATRFGQMEKNKILTSATLLDPRFKKLHLKSPLDVSRAVDSIKTEIRAVRRSMMSAVETASISSSDGNGDEDENLEILDHGSENLWQVHKDLQKRLETNRVSNTQPDVSQTISAYLNQPTIPLDTNPIEYWKQHEILSTSRERLNFIDRLTYPTYRISRLN
jgi:hypothetical protein